MSPRNTPLHARTLKPLPVLLLAGSLLPLTSFPVATSQANSPELVDNVTAWTALFFADSPRHGSATAESGTSVSTRYHFGAKWVTFDKQQTDDESAALTLFDGEAGGYYQFLTWKFQPATCCSGPYWFILNYKPTGRIENLEESLTGASPDTDRDNPDTPNLSDPWVAVDSRFYETTRSLCTSNAQVTWKTSTSKVVVRGARLPGVPDNFDASGQISLGVSKSYAYTFPAGYCWNAQGLGKGKGYAFEFVGPYPAPTAYCGGAMWEAAPSPDLACLGENRDTGDILEELYPDEDPLPEA